MNPLRAETRQLRTCSRSLLRNAIRQLKILSTSFFRALMLLCA